jgi:hypothetical protein
MLLPETPPVAARSRACIVVGAITTGAGLVLLRRPASQWLRALSPDGTLEPSTAMLLDRVGPLVLAAGLVLLACGFVPRLRHALAGAATAPAPAVANRARGLAPACAAFALLLRLAIAAGGDAGLGDDGARVVWLEQWLRDPHWVWTGLWLPAHLYLHALFTLVLRDAVWAGIALSAVAAAGTVWIVTRVTQVQWGNAAGAAAGLAASILPVSLAYGATPDVNPVFAFFVVAAVAAVLRARQDGGWRWLAISGLCLVTATWMRFDSLPLVPLIALLLWPRRLTALLFALAGIAPLIGWNIANALLSRASGGGPLGRWPRIRPSAARRCRCCSASSVRSGKPRLSRSSCSVWRRCGAPCGRVPDALGCYRCGDIWRPWPVASWSSGPDCSRAISFSSVPWRRCSLASAWPASWRATAPSGSPRLQSRSC